MTEPALAFSRRNPEPVHLEVRINFGIFAGREATPAELDELARELLTIVDRVSLVSEQRYEVGSEAKAALHQVRIEIGADAVASGAADSSSVEGQLVAAAERWARSCIADRHAQVSEL